MFPLEITSFQQSPHELSDVHHVVAYRLVHRGIVNAVVIKVIVVHVMQMAVHDNVVVVSVLHDVMRVISTQDVHKLLLVVAMAVRVIAISRGSIPHALLKWLRDCCGSGLRLHLFHFNFSAHGSQTFNVELAAQGGTPAE